jgi:LmbE family N-acetylglucosaminyl deacetylase
MPNPAAFAIAAHPDDIEFLMAGTLLRLKAAGYETHYMNLADGCCGSTQHSREEIAQIRLAEAKKAAAELGAVFHTPLCPDLAIFYEQKTLARLTSIIRQVSPRIVLTHAPSDYMEDHTNTCRLAVTAAFCRGMPNFPVDPPRPAIAERVTVYHAQPYGNVTPLRDPVRAELFIDTTGLQERKLAALRKHASQQRWLDESQGLNSYLAKMQELDREVGRMSGRFEYAEGWRRHLHLGFCGPEDDPLAEIAG